MKNMLMCLLMGTLLFSCGPAPKAGDNATGESRFHTTPPSLLYFKNMRSTTYSMEEQPQSRIELYRHKQFGPAGERPAVYPIIANNWLQDEAYLFLERGNAPMPLHEPLTFAADTTGSSDFFRLQGARPGQQYDLALDLYKGLQNKKQWFIKQRNGQFAPLYQEGNERTAFLVTLRDYLKLTEAD
ncbi:MAG: hypothetical protein GVY26_04390 [Bacteroidetes bacterium]|jgi:hypothetical protein|nr:hypothetical protein [Bacteroidota bacterium]